MPTEDWGPTTASALARAFQQKAKNTKCVVFKTIDRRGILKPKETNFHIDTIKKKHCFLYRDEKCYASYKSGDAMTEFDMGSRFVHVLSHD